MDLLFGFGWRTSAFVPPDRLEVWGFLRGLTLKMGWKFVGQKPVFKQANV